MCLLCAALFAASVVTAPELQPPAPAFEVSNFTPWTHRGIFEQPSPEDFVRGFPRIEFSVRWLKPLKWRQADLWFEATGVKGKKRQPVWFSNTISLNELHANSPAFFVVLPASFTNAEVTGFRTAFRRGVFERPYKVIFGKARVISLDHASDSTYEDSFLSAGFRFDEARGNLSVRLKNVGQGRIAIEPEHSASLEYELADAPQPPLEFLGLYQNSSFGPDPAWIAPGADAETEVPIRDRRECRPDPSVEVELDPVCRAPGSVLRKYSRMMEDGYVLVRLLLPVRVEESVREYVFTFVLTKNGKVQKKKDPEAVRI